MYVCIIYVSHTCTCIILADPIWAQKGKLGNRSGKEILRFSRHVRLAKLPTCFSNTYSGAVHRRFVAVWIVALIRWHAWVHARLRIRKHFHVNILNSDWKKASLNEPAPKKTRNVWKQRTKDWPTSVKVWKLCSKTIRRCLLCVPGHVFVFVNNRMMQNHICVCRCMHLCVYVWVYVCKYVCIICIYIYIHMHAYICMHMCVLMRAKSAHRHTHTWTRTDACTMHTHIHICSHTHAHTYCVCPHN